MQPPLAIRLSLGIGTPPSEAGLKVAVIDPYRSATWRATLFTPSHRAASGRLLRLEAIVNHLIDKHKVTLIAIGNAYGITGNGGVSSPAYPATLRSQHPTEELFYLIISEAVASVLLSFHHGPRGISGSGTPAHAATSQLHEEYWTRWLNWLKLTLNRLELVFTQHV